MAKKVDSKDKFANIRKKLAYVEQEIQDINKELDDIYAEGQKLIEQEKAKKKK